MYYRGAAAVIVAYDITDEVTMVIDCIVCNMSVNGDHVIENIRAMQSWIDELHKLGPENLTMAIAGTKCDRENEREV